MSGTRFLFCIPILILLIACKTQLVTTDRENDYTRYIDEKYREEYHEPVYYVIVSSFANKKGAEKYRETLVNEGYEARIVKADMRFRVAINTYSNKTAADKAKDNYNSSHTPGNAWIFVAAKNRVKEASD